MPLRFIGSDFQINVDDGGGNGVLGNQQLAQITTLSDGRFGVVYQSAFFGNSSNQEAIAAILNADGSFSSTNYVDLFTNVQNQTQPVLAPLPTGGFGAAFTNAAHADGSTDTTNNITYVRVAANGALGTPLAVGDFNAGAGHDGLASPATATLSTGRQVVAFEQVFTAGVDDNIFLNVVSADGLSTQFSAATGLAVENNSSWQSHPAVAAIGNSALVVYEDGTGTTTASANISGRIFDGATNTVGAPITIADHTAELFNPQIVALDDHRYAIFYEDNSEIFGKIYDVTTNTLSAEFEVDSPGGSDTAVSAAATADGGFIVSWESFNGTDFDILTRRFNSDGGPIGQQFLVNRTTTNDFNPTVSVSGANALFAWTDLASRPSDDNSPTSVRGQVMSLTTPPDFNGNGISDILWRNDNGSLVSWNMSSTSTFAGAFVTLNGNVLVPDASWSVAGLSDFNGDGKTDVLWHNTNGSLVDWTMNGSVVTASAFVTLGGSVVAPDASWSVAGVGDFDRDGKSDILWRNVNGQLVDWTMNGSTVTSAAFVTLNGTVLAPDSSWSILGIGDFNADGNADILWGNSNGSIVEWLMNGSTVSSSAFVTSAGSNVSVPNGWHVVEIGDFNGDARGDVLWRNDNGALLEWLMSGTTIASTTSPTAGGVAVSPDASWHTQAKPTDFA